MAEKDLVTYNKKVETSAGPYLAKVINLLDSEYMGTLQVQLMKSNTTGGPNEEASNVYSARYLSPFAGQTPRVGITKNDDYETLNRVMVSGQFHLM